MTAESPDIVVPDVLAFREDSARPAPSRAAQRTRASGSPRFASGLRITEAGDPRLKHRSYGIELFAIAPPLAHAIAVETAADLASTGLDGVETGRVCGNIAHGFLPRHVEPAA